ncbi:DnaT-like ssDNA-binding domain-containing protein [Gynuella sp.]|uniref:DnaT-like ssDNA-binding domain-containing protein n=1 Tax=Gynuella sp. TaxID=2969146 RepID=UPI003D100F57
MTIQFGERLLSISPNLAMQIGLEEAVLAQLVFELSTICPNKTLLGKEWFYLAPERWPELVPFWNMTKLNQIFRNLEALKVIERHFNDNGQFLVRLIPDNAFNPAANQGHQRVSHNPAQSLNRPSQSAATTNAARARNQRHAGLPTFMIEQSQQFQQGRNYKTAMRQDWYPDENLLIPRLQADNITVDFAREQLPAFIGHYMETGVAAADWNSRFIRWVKEEWAKMYRSAPQHSNYRQDQRDEVRRKIMDIYDTNW